MNKENAEFLCSLDPSSEYDKIPVVTATYPQFGLRNPNRYNNKAVRICSIKDVEFTRSGCFYKSKLIIESCLLGQFGASVSNAIGDNYVSNIIRDLPALERCEDYITDAYYCANAWDKNYQHFIIETLPKIFLASLIGGAPIYVSDYPYVREILSYLCPSSDIVYMKNQMTVYRCHNLRIIPPIAENFDPLTDLQLFALKSLSNAVTTSIANDNKTREKLSYIGRINTSGISGIQRRIINESDLLASLNSRKVPMYDFNGMSLADKRMTVALSEVQITPIGANLMNYIFADTPIRLYVINHPYFKSHQYFVNLFRDLRLPIDYKILECAVKADQEHDLNNDINSPYLVDIDAISQVISEEIGL